MKKIILSIIVIALFAVKVSIARETRNGIIPISFSLKEDTTGVDTTIVSKSDTTEIKIGHTRVVIIGKPQIHKIYKDEKEGNDDDDNDNCNDKEESSHNKKPVKNVNNNYFDMDLGFNSLLDNNQLNLSAANAPLYELKNSKSVNYALYLFTSKINLVNHNFNFIYRIGLDYNNYRFTNDTLHLIPRKETATGEADYEGGKVVKYSKNKLVSNYLTVPLMLQYQNYTKKGKTGFQIAAGVEMGYLIDSRVKLVSEYGKTIKLDDDFNLQSFRYGFVGRIGYGNIGFYAKYYPSTLFASGQGPALNTLSFGIALFGF